MPPSGDELSAFVTIPAGAAWFGSEDFYAGEAPRVWHKTEEFQLEQHPVTNQQFAAFVVDTGWVTTVERAIPEHIPSIPEELRTPGSLVFTGTAGPVDLRHSGRWWTWVPGDQLATPLWA